MYYVLDFTVGFNFLVWRFFIASTILVMDYTYIKVYFLHAASGPGRCKINNGGCWHDSRDGLSFSACLVGVLISFWFSLISVHVFLFLFFILWVSGVGFSNR